MSDQRLHQHPVRDLPQLFLRAAEVYPDRPALEVDDRVISYEELRQGASGVATALREVTGDDRVACVLGERSAGVYAAVLGVLLAGLGYVPLNPRFPAARTAAMLEASGAGVIVVAPEGVPILRAMAPGIGRSVIVLCLDGVDAAGLAGTLSGHTVLAVPPDGASRPGSAVDPSDVAYLLFTSGSTGRPKGVPIRHRNVAAYLGETLRRYEPGPGDRCSQAFDLTFDLSVHDLFVAWANGSCLCVVPRPALMAPSRFIRSRKLTTWFSVPSVVSVLDRMRLLRPGAFPDLRLSLFCGEALLRSQAEAWQRAAPASVVENLYGPTEATIAITRYRWVPGESEPLCRAGVVPIGEPFAGHSASVISPSMDEVGQGETGELYLAGPQVADGYLEDPERTAERFLPLPGRDPGTWYRTGDLVVRGAEGTLHFVGRVDDQVQVRGHRVELAEVEHVLRTAAGMEIAMALPWPPGPGNAEMIYAFVEHADSLDEAAVRGACGDLLPSYMVPERIFAISPMPRNANGKLDRKALLNELEERLHAQRA